MSRHFTVLSEVDRHYTRFNAYMRELTVRVMSPVLESAGARDPTRYFANSVKALFKYTVRDLDPSDVVGISIRKNENQLDSPYG
jgi:hypothetical protein